MQQPAKKKMQSLSNCESYMFSLMARTHRLWALLGVDLRGRSFGSHLEHFIDQHAQEADRHNVPADVICVAEREVP